MLHSTAWDLPKVLTTLELERAENTVTNFYWTLIIQENEQIHGGIGVSLKGMDASLYQDFREGGETAL